LRSQVAVAATALAAVPDMIAMAHTTRQTMNDRRREIIKRICR